MTRSRKNTPILTRLLNNIEIDEQTDCWVWMGAKNNIGYGLIRDGKQMRTTHKASYETHHNTKVPVDLCVCHNCDNYLCVNPSHLYTATRKSRTQETIRKGRAKFFGGKTMKGFKHKKYECNHCHQFYARSMLVKWHNDKCKHKEI